MVTTTVRAAGIESKRIDPVIWTRASRFTSDRLTLRHGDCDVDEVTYKVADSRRERTDAFRLVYEAYVRRGLIHPNPEKMRVTPHHLLPLTDVFVAKHGGRVIYAMTLISDDELGLPLEELYPDEINSLRGQGLHLAEVSCLASQKGILSPTGMFDVFTNLVALMFQQARHNQIDRLVIAVHPRHLRFYRRLLGFTQIGPLRDYASVCDNPAVAAEHDFAATDLEPYRLYDRIYGRRFRPVQLLRQPMPQIDRHFYRPNSQWYTGPQTLNAA